MESLIEQPKKRRGRPPGVRNKPKPPLARMTPPSRDAGADYRHADPDSIVSRQIAMLDWAQQAMRNEMQRAMQKKGEWIATDDIVKLEKLSNAIVRAIEALKKSSDLTAELAARLTPAELLEAALKKIEGQDAATIRYAIKRLRAYLEKISPLTRGDHPQLGPNAAATDVLAELVGE